MITIIVKVFLSIMMVLIQLILISIWAVFSTNREMLKSFFITLLHEIYLLWNIDTEEMCFEFRKRDSNR